MYRDHAPEAREILRKAGLSMASELTSEERERLQEAVEMDAVGNEMTTHGLRNYIMPSQGKPEQPALEAAASTDNQEEGESIMAKKTVKRSGGRPTRSALTKAVVTRLAKLRRDGGTWADVSAEAGQVRSSTGWAEVFDEYGFDKLGRKDGKGTSKARGWNTASENGASAKKSSAKKGGAKRRVKRTRATAKK